ASGKNDINGWPSDGTLDSAKLDALVSATARSGVWNCPTEVLFQLHLWPSDSMMAWPEMRYMRQEILTSWSADIHRLPGAEHALDLRRQVIRALRDAGAGLLLGTDGGAPFLVPGFSVHRELQALVRAGLTPY